MLIHTFLDRPAKQGDRLQAILSQKTKVFEKHSSRIDDIERTAKKTKKEKHTSTRSHWHMVLTYESLDEILKCDHSNESY